MDQKEMQETVTKFRAEHPNVEGLNIRQMAQILAGELVMVKVAGKRRFVLMTKAEVTPGGKLDQHNAKVARHNRKIRITQRARIAEFNRRFADIQATDGIMAAVEDAFKRAVKE